MISYVIIGALADAFPTAVHFNRGAAIVQVVFIYVIQMVSGHLSLKRNCLQLTIHFWFIQAYSGALGPCAWIYASEIFPTNLRDKGVNISQAGQQITTLWINQTWPVMFSNIGHNAYWILMGINVLGLMAVTLFWPETKGISLEHMEKIFGETDKVEAFMGEHRVSTVSDVHHVLDDDKGVVEHGD